MTSLLSGQYDVTGQQVSMTSLVNGQSDGNSLVELEFEPVSTGVELT